MSCIQNLFRCNFNDNGSNTSQQPIDNWNEKQMEFLRSKVIDCELDIKGFKNSFEIEFLRSKIIDCELNLKTFTNSFELELKRIDDKIMSQIQILNTKLDATLCSKI